MGFYERIEKRSLPEGDSDISLHAFEAAVVLYKNGVESAQTVGTLIGLSASEKVEVQTLLLRVQNNQASVDVVRAVLMWLEHGLYTVAQAKTKLGVA